MGNMRKQDRKVILKGFPASPGVVSGKIFKIQDPGRFVEVPIGNIVVTEFATPLLTLVLLNCTGIVTEKGGVTCHAATIARELGIPCIVGAEGALKKLMDGMEVTLDGTKGSVYR